MNTKLATRQIRIAEWASIIKACKSSGLKVDEYCRQNNISRDAYYYWLRKVKEAALLQSGFVEIPLEKQPSEPFRIQMIVKAGNTELCINDSTPSELLSRVLEVIHNVK